MEFCKGRCRTFLWFALGRPLWPQMLRHISYGAPPVMRVIGCRLSTRKKPAAVAAVTVPSRRFTSAPCFLPTGVLTVSSALIPARCWQNFGRRGDLTAGTLHRWCRRLPGNLAAREWWFRSIPMKTLIWRGGSISEGFPRPPGTEAGPGGR